MLFTYEGVDGVRNSVWYFLWKTREEEDFLPKGINSQFWSLENNNLHSPNTVIKGNRRDINQSRTKDPKGGGREPSGTSEGSDEDRFLSNPDTITIDQWHEATEYNHYAIIEVCLHTYLHLFSS